MGEGEFLVKVVEDMSEEQVGGCAGISDVGKGKSGMGGKRKGKQLK